MTKQAIDEKVLEGFEGLLSKVETGQLAGGGYAKRYLAHLILHKKYYCRIYAQLLHLVLQHSNKSKDSICLVDYGCGNGLMGLLAKYAGFGKVYLNDINPDFLEAAKQLAASVNIAVDGYIEGDIEQVKKYFANSQPDAIAGTDVLEHIYNLDDFFSIVKKVNPCMVTVMSTACNPGNYIKVKGFKKMQVKDELYGGSPGDNVLFGENAMEAFIEIRRKIIHAYSKGQLSRALVDSLATATRGLRKDDIEKTVKRFMADNILPAALPHPTNTCDPLTGSWSERLLSFEEYKLIYSNTGFNLVIYDGFYNEYENSLKSSLLYWLNKLIPAAGHRLSPYIIMVGT